MGKTSDEYRHKFIPSSVLWAPDGSYIVVVEKGENLFFQIENHYYDLKEAKKLFDSYSLEPSSKLYIMYDRGNIISER